MPTMNPRVTITVPKEMLDRIENFKWDNRIRNQTQAIKNLINRGLDSIMNQPENSNNTFIISKDDERILKAYHCADPIYRTVALELLESHPAQEKEKLA